MAVRPRWTTTAGALLAAAIGLTTPVGADPDLWGHLRFGLDSLSTLTLPSIDPYSFTQDRPWINHEWLSEVKLALAWRVGGVPGLLLLKAVFTGATLWIVWRALAGVEFPIRLAGTAIALVGIGRTVGTIRPQLWSLLFFAILVSTLERRAVNTHRWLPLLFVVWANVHGGWIVGLGTLALWQLGEAIAAPHTLKRGAIVTTTCVLATLCTPYGWRLWAFLWETVGLGRDITEWQPVWTVPPTAWIAWIAAATLAVWMAASRPVPWAALMVVCFLGYASFRVERVTAFFVLAGVLFSAPLVARRWPARPVEAPAALRAAAEMVVAVLFAFALWRTSLQTCLPIDGEWIPDRQVAQQLRHAEGGRLVTFFDWGQFAIWHWGPRLRVSTDGRRETVYSAGRLVEHDDVVAGTSRGLESLAAWNPEYVWLPAASVTTKSWLMAHGYRLDGDTTRSYLAVRGDLPVLNRSEAITGSWCFP